MSGAMCTGVAVCYTSHHALSTARRAGAGTGQLYLRWEGGTEELVDRVIVDRCDHEEAESGWIVFVGGFYVTEPGCYPITVAGQGRSQEAHLSIGVPCGRYP